LRPPVLVPPPTNVPPPVAASKLTLTGITTIFGKSRAMLTAQGTKPQDAGKQELYSLAVGQRVEGIEVLSIDQKKGVVRVRNNGVEETLDFINNGAKLVASAAPPGGIPGVPGGGMVGGRPALNRQLPSAPSAANTAGMARGNPGYGGGPGSGVANAYNQGSYNQGFGGSQATVTVGSTRNRQPFVNPHAPEMDPAVQAVMMEKNRQETMNAVLSGDMPPIPPGFLTPENSPDLAPPVAPPDL
jgi:hypothetical protein